MLQAKFRERITFYNAQESDFNKKVQSLIKNYEELEEHYKNAEFQKQQPNANVEEIEVDLIDIEDTANAIDEQLVELLNKFYKNPEKSRERLERLRKLGETRGRKTKEENKPTATINEQDIKSQNSNTQVGGVGGDSLQETNKQSSKGLYVLGAIFLGVITLGVYNKYKNG